MGRSITNRAEFWGDELTDLRAFSVADQRAFPDLDYPTVDVYPARELLITDDVAGRAAELAVAHRENPTLQELLTKVADRIPADDMKTLIPVLADLTATPMRTLPELMPAPRPRPRTDWRPSRSRPPYPARSGSPRPYAPEPASAGPSPR